MDQNTPQIIDNVAPDYIRTPEILVEGEFSPQNVSISDTGNIYEIHNPAIQERVDELESTGSSRNMHNGVLYNLEDFYTDGVKLHLSFGQCNFYDYIAAHISPFTPELSESELPKALIVSAFIETSDGYLIFGDRGEDPINGKSNIGLIGGTYNKDELEDDSDKSPFRMIEKEINEELGIDPSVIDDIKLLAVANDPILRRPAILMTVNLPLSLREVRDSFAAKGDKKEHNAIMGVQSNIDEYEAVLKGYKTTPVTKLGLQIYSNYKERH